MLYMIEFGSFGKVLGFPRVGELAEGEEDAALGWTSGREGAGGGGEGDGEAAQEDGAGHRWRHDSGDDGEVV